MNITVVIPLYNKAETIERAVNSVLSQTYPPQEIIIIDDGSTDGSTEQLKNIADNRIRFIRQANQGVAMARNTGIHVAKSTWVAFLDGDDEWKPNFLNTIQTLHNIYKDAQVLATAYESTYDSKTFKKLRLYKLPFNVSHGILSNYFEVAANSMPPICSSAIAIRKKAIEEIGGFPKGLQSGEDLLTWAKLASKFQIAYSLEPLATIHLGNAHTYKEVPFRPPDEEDQVGKELVRLYNNYCSKGLQEYIGLWYKMRASIYLCSGKNKKALQAIVTSFKYSFQWKMLIYGVLVAVPLKIRLNIFRILQAK